MRYIILTELENTNFISCKIQGLESYEWINLEQEFINQKLTYIKQNDFVEVDTRGIQILNILAGNNYNYKVESQSMTIEKSNIGSRIIQVQKIIWTLSKI